MEMFDVTSIHLYFSRTLLAKIGFSEIYKLSSYHIVTTKFLEKAQKGTTNLSNTITGKFLGPRIFSRTKVNIYLCYMKRHRHAAGSISVINITIYY